MSVKTYRQLRDRLNLLTDEQLDCNVTIHLTEMDEYFAASDFYLSDEEVDDRLDDQHPYISV